MLLTGCTQTRTEIKHPTRFESKQSRSAPEVGDAARWMLATNFSTQMGRRDKLQQSSNEIRTAWSFSLFSVPGICTVNEGGDTKSRQEKRQSMTDR
jgi:hypothetical protein